MTYNRTDSITGFDMLRPKCIVNVTTLYCIVLVLQLYKSLSLAVVRYLVNNTLTAVAQRILRPGNVCKSGLMTNSHDKTALKM